MTGPGFGAEGLGRVNLLNDGHLVLLICNETCATPAVQGSGFRISGFGFRASGFGVWASDFGFGVWGLGCEF